MSRYSEFNIYDAPSAIAGQALKGQLSLKNARDAVLNPENLSPSERQNLYQTLTGGGSGNRIVDTLGNIATSPWLYIALLTGPLGVEALKGGKSLFMLAAAKNPMARKTLTMLESAGVMGLSTMMPSHAVQAGQDMQGVIEEGLELAARMGAKTEAALRVAIETRLAGKGVIAKITTLNPEDYKGVVGEEVNRVMWGIRVRGTGLDDVAETSYQRGKLSGFTVTDRNGNVLTPSALPKDLTEELEALENVKGAPMKTYTSAVEGLNNRLEQRAVAAQQAGNAAGSVPFRVTIKMEEETLLREKRAAYFNKGDTDRLFAEYPEALAHVEMMEDVGRIGYVKLVGDETRMLTPQGDLVRGGAFHTDQDKLERLAEVLRHQKLGEGDNEATGAKLLGWIVGQDNTSEMWRLVKKGDAGAIAQAKAMLDAKLSTEWGQKYAPRNLMKPAEVVGVELPKGMRELEEDYHTMAVGAGRVIPRTDAVPLYHNKDMVDAGKHFGLTKEGMDHISLVDEEAAKALRRGREKDGFKETLSTHSLRLEDSHARYVVEVHRAHALNTAAVSDAAYRHEAHNARQVPTETRQRQTQHGFGGPNQGYTNPNTGASHPGISVPLGEPLRDGLKSRGIKDTSNYMLLQRAHDGMVDPARQAMLRNVLIPSLVGSSNHSQMAYAASIEFQKSMAGKFAKSKIGNMVRAWGGKHGAAFVDDMEEFSKKELNPTGTQTMSRHLANYLFVTHMGFNVSSVLVNMMQPLTLAAGATGLGGIAKGYGKAIKEVFGYVAERVGSGKAFATDVERAALIKKHFKWADQAGITPDWMRLVEGRSGVDGWMGRASKLAMNLFEKSEWFNKSAAGHMLEHAYVKAGRNVMTDPLFKSDMRGWIASTQFAPDKLFTPLVFLEPDSQIRGVKMHGLLSNPLVKMFMQFPVRTATNFWAIHPDLGGAEGVASKLKYWGRAFAISAVVNEVGKGILGVHLSRGLAASSVTDVMGGNKVLYNDQWYPMPPVVRMATNLVRGLGGDTTAMADFLATSVPGGIALGRAVGVMPQLSPLMGAGLLQKTYADYGNIQPDGTVPVYKWDGTLIENKTPAEIVMRGLGVDLGSWGEQGAIDGYLIKQRARILKYRHEFLRRLAGNDTAGAEAIRREFGTKFKDPVNGQPMPLTVTQQQVKSYMRARAMMGRTERILDSLPADARSQYAAFAEGAGASRGIDLTSGATASTRERGDTTIQDDRIRELQRRVEAVGPAAAQKTGFDKFASYSGAG